MNIEQDQYSRFDKISLLLKRFSFDEKMDFCHKYSVKAMPFENADDYYKLRALPTPWIIETFALLAIEAREYDNKKLDDTKFEKMINAILRINPESIKKHVELPFKEYFFPITALTQFSLQESKWIKYYRFWRFFTNNEPPTNLQKVFEDKFGTCYYDFLLLSLCLQELYSLGDIEITKSLIDYIICHKFEKAFQSLTISRKDYISLLHKFVDDSNDKSEYIYCIRPSYMYSFIEYNDSIYFPLPHLLTQNITSSLLYRLTDGDNHLRENIGKHIIEKYLFEIIDNSDIYEEVYCECEYFGKGGSNAKSPDVMAKDGENIIFFDSKSTVPSKGIRLFDLTAYKKNIDINAENVAKLYNQIDNFLKKYNPFQSKINYDKNCYWGIIVVLEDAYIPREKIYKRAYEVLDFQDDKLKQDWISKHIKILTLYQIECLCFCHESVIDSLKEQEMNGLPYDFSFSTTHNMKIKDQNIIGFISNLKKSFLELFNELRKDKNS